MTIYGILGAFGWGEQASNDRRLEKSQDGVKGFRMGSLESRRMR